MSNTVISWCTDPSIRTDTCDPCQCQWVNFHVATEDSTITRETETGQQLVSSGTNVFSFSDFLKDYGHVCLPTPFAVPLSNGGIDVIGAYLKNGTGHPLPLPQFTVSYNGEIVFTFGGAVTIDHQDTASVFSFFPANVIDVAHVFRGRVNAVYGDLTRLIYDGPILQNSDGSLDKTFVVTSQWRDVWRKVYSPPLTVGDIYEYTQVPNIPFLINYFIHWNQ